jgi:site-specific DNA recombinase
MKLAAIYARVSSDQQKQEHTIDSQTQTLIAFAQDAGYSVPAEWVFEDIGYSGATLVRPGLERVRDLAAERQIEAVLALSPDRLSRKYAYQVLLIEELTRHGVATVFVKAPTAQTPALRCPFSIPNAGPLDPSATTGRRRSQPTRRTGNWPRCPSRRRRKR